LPVERMVCPLSLQEMLLVLRNEILSALFIGNACGQFLNPMMNTDTSQNAFIPYMVGPTTCPIGTVGMKLPLPMVENVRSLITRCSTHSSGDIEWFITVLGQYLNDSLLQSEYNFGYIVSDVTTQTPSFTVLANVMKKRLRDSKGKEYFTPMVEPILSLIDGQSGTGYYFINDKTRLQVLATEWNNWISNYSQFSSQLVTLSTELGINVLSSVATTMHWVETGTQQKAIEAEFLDGREAKVRLSSVYTNREAVALSQKGGFLQGPTEQVLQVWILPVNQIVDWNPQAKTSFTRIQDLTSEPNILALTSTGTNGENLAAKHNAYAQKMIKGIASQESDWDAFFKQMSAVGQGGILSSLVAGMAGSLFGPAVGNIATTVASMIPV